MKNPYHMKRLLLSNQDMVALGQAVLERYKSLKAAHIRILGVPLHAPKDLLPAFNLFDEMVTRHLRGDFRSYVAEEQATKEIAQWTVDVNCALRNQEPITIQWQ